MCVCVCVCVCERERERERERETELIPGGYQGTVHIYHFTVFILHLKKPTHEAARLQHLAFTSGLFLSRASDI